MCNNAILVCNNCRKVGAEVVELAGVGVVAAIPDLELGTLDGITGDAVHLADLQTGLDGVEEGNGRGLAGFQRYLLRNWAENDMTGNIDLRDLVATHGDGIEEDAPRAVRRGTGGVAAVDLFNEISDALDRLSGGNIFLQNFESRLFIVNEDDFGGLAGAQRYGLLGVRHYIINMLA